MADGSRGLELTDLWRLAAKASRRWAQSARQPEPPDAPEKLIADFLRVAGGGLPVVAEEWPGYDQVNVQGALDAWLAEDGRSWELVGLSARHMAVSLGDLAQPADPRFPRPRVGNVSLTQLPAGPGGEVRSCVRCGLFLVTEPDGERMVLLCAEGQEQHGGGLKVQVEALCSDPPRAVSALAQLRSLAVERSVFRGQILTFTSEVFGPRRTGVLGFERRPTLRREELILPDGLIELVERQVLGIARHRDRLQAAGQHLKRGLLLFGPPGTGKTHTVRYLLGRLEGVTVLILSGQALGSVGAACSIARALQPAAVVIEDVDLIADQRGLHPGSHPLLFQVLNEMDGLGEDVDITFILTTNRADLLEPALAARPGRVDQAVEIPLPDAAARRRLLELYRAGLPLEAADLDAAVERTDGVTASFLKEALRRAALIASEMAPASGGDLQVSTAHLQTALDELLDVQAKMTRTILGG